MRKYLIILLSLCLLTLGGCSSDTCSIVENTYSFESSLVDMSGYDGMSSTEHQFRQIKLPVLYDILDNKGSGVFYLGYVDCPHCQQQVKLINEAAELNNVTVYYIDAYDSEYPLVEAEAYAKFKEIFYDFLRMNDDKTDRTIQTPMVFTINNGNIEKAIVGSGTLTEYGNLMKCYK